MKPITTPVQVTYRNMEPSSVVTARINLEAAKLERYFSPIIGCRVVIEAPHRHHRFGRRYQLRVEITVPGDHIVVQHEPAGRPTGCEHAADSPAKRDEADASHKDINVLIRDVFDSVRRRLEDHARRRRGDVKTHLPADAPLPV